MITKIKSLWEDIGIAYARWWRLHVVDWEPVNYSNYDGT